MSVLAYERYARLSLRKYRKSFGWPVVDNFLAIIYTCDPARVIRITFSLIPVLVLTSDVSNESSLLPPYSLSRSITILKFRSCVKYDAVASRRANNAAMTNFLDKSGSQISGMGGIVSVDSVHFSGFINRFRTYDRCLKFVVWYLERNLFGKKRKILFHLERSKTFFPLCW